MNNQYMKKRNKDCYDIAFMVLLVVCIAFLCWKARFGSADRDESFYITIGYRMWQGDTMYLDEMNGGQTFAFLIYPIMCLYMAIFGSTEGIVLFYRYVFVAFQFFVSIFLFRRFKSFSEIGALIASIMWLLFAPFNEMALYYNTLGMMGLVISLTLLLTHRNNYELIVSGIFFAASVLCNPYNAISYFIYLSVVIVFAVTKKNNEMLNLKTWSYITVGISFLAIIFLVFVFSKISLNEFLKNVPYFLTDDAHKARSVFEIIKTYLEQTFGFTNYTLYLYLVLFLVFIANLFDRNKKKRKYLYSLAFAGIGTLLLFFTYSADQHLNFVMYPLNMVGFFCGTISNREDVRKILFAYSVPALAYTLYSHAASNVGVSVICSSSTVCLISCIVIICCVFEEIANEIEKKRIVSFLVTASFALLMLFQMGLEAYLRYVDCFPDPLDIQDTLVEYGPCKGLIEEAGEKENYDKVMNVIDHVRKNYSERKALFLCYPTWVYLAAEDYSNCSTSSWNSLHQSGYNYMSNYYYSVNKEKIPEIIVAGYDMYDPDINNLEIIDMYEMVEEYGNNRIYLRKK